MRQNAWWEKLYLSDRYDCIWNEEAGELKLLSLLLGMSINYLANGFDGMVSCQ